MPHKPFLILLTPVIITAVVLFGCSKKTTEQEPEGPAHGYLVKIAGQYNGSTLEFEHDDLHRITYYAERDTMLQYFIYYKDRHLVSHAVCAVWDTRWLLRSVIFSYNSQNKPVRVNYSKGVVDKSPADPILASLAPQDLSTAYDTLIYDGAGRLKELQRFNFDGPNQRDHWQTVVFHYDRPDNDFPYKLEHFGLYGQDHTNLQLVEEFYLYTDGTDAPYTSLWYQPFFERIGAPELPILSTDLPTQLSSYLPLISKCITRYELKHRDPYYSRNLADSYTCAFNADSTIFTISYPASRWHRADYFFKR